MKPQYSSFSPLFAGDDLAVVMTHIGELVRPLLTLLARTYGRLARDDETADAAGRRSPRRGFGNMRPLGPAGHIEGTCGRNAPDKDEKEREPIPEVSGPSRAKRLVASSCGAVRQLPAATEQTWIGDQPMILVCTGLNLALQHRSRQANDAHQWASFLQVARYMPRSARSPTHSTDQMITTDLW